MTDIRKQFLELTKVALVDFSVNHPGNKVSAKILEQAFKVTDEEINAALEKHKTLAEAVDEFIKYVFTNGRNFKKPSWLQQ